MKIFVVCWTGVRRLFTEALSWLNAIGAVLLMYLLANPSAPGELIDVVPVHLQPIAKVLIPLVWFALVQRAKTFDIKRKEKADGISLGN